MGPLLLTVEEGLPALALLARKLRSNSSRLDILQLIGRRKGRSNAGHGHSSLQNGHIVLYIITAVSTSF